jgi:hypothetical protein
MLDSALLHLKDIKYKGEVNGSKVYYAQSSLSALGTCKIELDAQTFFINRIEQGYNVSTEDGYVKQVIEYSLTHLIDPSQYKPETYLNINTKNITLNTQYAHYELIKLN